ncbi:cytosine/adenosine deaminase-related metal-dependent hydrolase [Streptomyces zagrosensis]|uniref:Cytosine/adenosine deaminase-related metal-dependent hydrolase n=1 Tax=Streptomyces zagrosensis TaxID=1042984 RepID=A0A7W9UX58_9ACTN|nr:cytosine/adenosine deaminase-related metal-dependent hydrolase [Streptomyces zagrosensis]
MDLAEFAGSAGDEHGASAHAHAGGAGGAGGAVGAGVRGVVGTDEREQVIRFWSQLGLPGLIDVHTHFMPERVLAKV